MKKVGILSMQRIANYGSFLQAYALKSILNELGCDVQFVDFHPGKCLVPTSDGNRILRNITKGSAVLKSKAPLKEKISFIKYKKNYALNHYPYLEIDDNIMNYYPELDVLIIGSDEVFNCVQGNTNVGFSPELFGVGNRAKRLISYAASFGNTTEEKMKQYKIDKLVSNWLKKFDALSVRDSNSGNIIKNLINLIPEYNLDPVIIYDFFGLCNEIPKKIFESNYMILYGYSNRFTKSECEYIREYAQKKGLKIICIGGVQDCCDKFVDCSPFEVLAYFQQADCIITDTFHGSIMSIITHRQFVSLVRREGYGNAEKMLDLLERLKLTERIITDIKKLSDMMEIKINYIKTDIIIEMERQKTKKFLIKHIFE